jgi:Flp pilus assembly protein TadG
MLDHIRSRLAARVRRFMPARVARRFARQQDGAAAVEFGLIALPFLALMFAILETALVFFAGQTLEAAAATAGRLIMTGQAQNGGFSQADFKQKVCDALVGGLFDCTNGVYVDVKTYTSFGSVNNASPISNGQFDSSKTGYSPGSQGSIVVVRLYYQWPIYVSLLGNNLANLGSGSRLLIATSVFRNEPY